MLHSEDNVRELIYETQGGCLESVWRKTAKTRFCSWLSQSGGQCGWSGVGQKRVAAMKLEKEAGSYSR